MSGMATHREKHRGGHVSDNVQNQSAFPEVGSFMHRPAEARPGRAEVVRTRGASGTKLRGRSCLTGA